MNNNNDDAVVRECAHEMPFAAKAPATAMYATTELMAYSFTECSQHVPSKCHTIVCLVCRATTKRLPNSHRYISHGSRSKDKKKMLTFDSFKTAKTFRMDPNGSGNGRTIETHENS